MKTKYILLGLLLVVLTLVSISLAVKSCHTKPTQTEIRQQQIYKENEKIADSVRVMPELDKWNIIGADFDSLAKAKN